MASTGSPGTACRKANTASDTPRTADAAPSPRRAAKASTPFMRPLPPGRGAEANAGGGVAGESHAALGAGVAALVATPAVAVVAAGGCTVAALRGARRAAAFLEADLV